MKGLKFLLYLTILFILILLFLVPFYYSDIGIFISDINQGRKTLSSSFEDLSSYLAHVDSWNVLWFLFLAGSIMIMHAFVEHFFLYRLDNLYSGRFILDGTVWMTKRLLSLVCTTLVFIFMTNMIVDFYSNVKIANEVEKIEKSKYTVLLLGTNKFLRDGKSENAYFSQRIDAVVELYNAGYVSKILISGDNSSDDYNEPRDMMSSLMAKGIPRDKIKLDFAGFRTLDSIVRSKTYFGYKDLLIVSQGFHLQRALFLSWHFGVDAIGYEADGNMNLTMFVREHLAVPKMILDIMVLNTQPEYGSTGVRQQIDSSQKNLILIAFILIYLSIATYLSYDAFNFGK